MSKEILVSGNNIKNKLILEAGGFVDVVRAAPQWAVPSLILGGAAVKAGIARVG